MNEDDRGFIYFIQADSGVGRCYDTAVSFQILSNSLFFIPFYAI
jgi:hypothetical protein